MKKIFKNTLIFTFIASIASLSGCKKDETRLVASNGTPPVLSTSANNLVLTKTNVAQNAMTLTWTDANFDYPAAISYELEIDQKGDNFAKAKAYTFDPGVKTKSFTVGDLNSLAVALGLSTDVAGQLEGRVKASLGTTVNPIYSSTLTLNVTPYLDEVVYPALLVIGGNSWVTPSTRTNGFLLTSKNYNSKYEGYLNLPNADGYGGDAFKLSSTADGKVYGWGGTSTTMAVGGGNLYLSPAPAYMKVNADVSALTINFTPCSFFISGDDNGWSTSATPMTYDPTTKTLVAHNVALTAGKSFVFTCNGGYDISYKVDADGKLLFAGPPSWAGNNIPISKTGTFTVTLDLSAGDGKYTYSVN